MKIALYLMNQKGFAVLQKLLPQKENIAYVSSSPDTGVQNDFYNEIQELCSQSQIPFYPRNSEIPASADYKIAVGWRWLIKDSDNLIVLHDSLLPKYRGFAPLVNCLIQGEPKIGVTALFASEEYDAGDIIASDSLSVNYPIKIQEAIEKISSCYENLIEQIFSVAAQGKKLPFHPQNEDEATYSLWRDNNDYQIDWNWDSAKIKRFIDAVGYPYLGAQTTANGKEVIIAEAETFPDITVEDRNTHIGKIIFYKQQKPVVICGKGLLKLNLIIEKDNTQNTPAPISFRTRFGQRPI